MITKSSNIIAAEKAYGLARKKKWTNKCDITDLASNTVWEVST